MLFSDLRIGKSSREAIDCKGAGLLLSFGLEVAFELRDNLLEALHALLVELSSPLNL